MELGLLMFLLNYIEEQILLLQVSLINRTIMDIHIIAQQDLLFGQQQDQTVKQWVDTW
jgi:hypothetical protein